LDEKVSTLTKYGTVEVQLGGEILVKGFEAENCTCRDVAVLAMTYAIGQLQQKLNEHIQRPGGRGGVTVD